MSEDVRSRGTGAGRSASATSVTELWASSVIREQGIDVRGAHSPKTAASGAASVGTAYGPAPGYFLSLDKALDLI
jgi:hypothetical protein